MITVIGSIIDVIVSEISVFIAKFQNFINHIYIIFIINKDGAATAKIKNDITGPYSYAYQGVSGEKPVIFIKIKIF